tara:strand:+ start:184 stop:945 length:762 start_codon:yes stop_codon:yes gene_type:complete
MLKVLIAAIFIFLTIRADTAVKSIKDPTKSCILKTTVDLLITIEKGKAIKKRLGMWSDRPLGTAMGKGVIETWYKIYSLPILFMSKIPPGSPYRLEGSFGDVKPTHNDRKRSARNELIGMGIGAGIGVLSSPVTVPLGALTGGIIYGFEKVRGYFESTESLERVKELEQIFTKLAKDKDRYELAKRLQLLIDMDRGEGPELANLAKRAKLEQKVVRRKLKMFNVAGGMCNNSGERIDKIVEKLFGVKYFKDYR